MAKVELRKPISALLDEKSKCEAQLTQLRDRSAVLQQKLQESRMEEHGFREAKETLPNTPSSKPSRTVFDQGIATAHKKTEDVLKELDSIAKDLEVITSKAKSFDKSIRDLQSA